MRVLGIVFMLSFANFANAQEKTLTPWFFCHGKDNFDVVVVSEVAQCTLDPTMRETDEQLITESFNRTFAHKGAVMDGVCFWYNDKADVIKLRKLWITNYYTRHPGSRVLVQLEKGQNPTCPNK